MILNICDNELLSTKFQTTENGSRVRAKVSLTTSGEREACGRWLFKVHDEDTRTTNTGDFKNKHLPSDNLIKSWFIRSNNEIAA